MRSRIFQIISVIAVCLSMSTAFALISYADTDVSYDPDKALKYAAEHCNDKTEWDGTKQDCVEFARTCVEKGGIPRDPKKVRLEGRGYTVQAYINYLVDNGYAELNKLQKDTIKFGSGKYYYIDAKVNGDKAASGDILVYKCTGASCGKYFHVALLNEPDTKGTYKNFYRHYAHNCSIDNKVVYAIRCSKCKRKPKYTEMYALHITLDKNTDKSGYCKVDDYYYLQDENGNKMTGVVTYDDFKYILSKDGKAVLYTAKTTDALNYRTGAGTSYKLKGTYKKGTLLYVTREENGWGQLRNGYWVKLTYTNNVKTYPVFIKFKARATDALNYRTGPSTRYKRVGTYNKGTLLNIVDKQGEWGKTRSGYWVNMTYTKRL